MEKIKLDYTDSYELYSDEIDQNYQIWIKVPWEYDKNSIEYPLFIFMDAKAQFPTVFSSYDYLYYAKDIPGAIIVGISHDGDMDDWVRLRALNFTPTKVCSKDLGQAGEMFPRSGGADDYIQFIMEKVIDSVKKRYRVKENDLTLIGHSAAGLFVSYVLLKYPHFFNRYIIGSPYLWWDKKYLFRLENEMFKKSKEINANVYTSIGGEETRKEMKEFWLEFFNSIKLHNYDGLNLEMEVIEKEHHFSVIPYNLQRGLKSIFKNWENEYPEQKRG